jgi:DnaD/phage-associated family protein
MKVLTMELSLDMGIWSSIFAVPTAIVDNHIKLAGSVQLKVLLWSLRNSGKSFSHEQIAQSLALPTADVKDALTYWIETGILSLKKQKPSYHLQKNFMQTAVPPQKSEFSPKTPARPLSRPQKPDAKSIAKRITQDEAVSFLMQEAQVILGRPISNGDSATLLMIHDNDGLPVDVITMILQYAVNVGKPSMKYIEKMAINWGEEGITTIQKAEQKIRSLDSHTKAWRTIERIIGIEHRMPTTKEDEATNRWINDWKTDEDLIKEAYERCVNANGKYILAYIDSIIKRWRKEGITTLQQALEQAKPTRKKEQQYTASYNIEEYEKSSIFWQ